MRLFRYRTPRFPANARLQFLVQGAVFEGICTNLSLGGLHALFDPDTLSLGQRGSLLLRYEEHELRFEGIVTHLDGRETGFSFSNKARGAVRQAVLLAGLLESESRFDRV